MLTGFEDEGIFAERRDEAGFGACGRVRLDCEDVDVEDIVLQEGDDAFHLLVEVIVLWDDGIGTEPTVRGEFAVLGPGIGQRHESFALHVAGLAGRDDILLVEGKRRLLREGGQLPLIVGRHGTQPLVVVEGLWEGGFVTAGAELRCLIEGLHHSGRVAIEVR